MVSERTIIILITIAILLSIISVAVTISTVNTKMLPKVSPPHITYNKIPDTKGAQVSLIVGAPTKK
ncbi:MAG: hypothetical protein QXW97_04680 [Candidatus Pacearchaeota archaeon]